MNFDFTEKQLAVKDAARNFAKQVLRPEVVKRDREARFPTEEIKQMAKMGFMGMMVSPEYGGSGMDTISYVLAMEEISKIDASAGVIMSVNNSLVCWGLEKYGNEQQKKKYLTKLATGEKLGAFCLSEPEAGSDATKQRTIAEDKGDYYLLNGTKNWVTNGSSSDIHIVVAHTNPELKHKGISVFIVEADWEGVDIGKKEEKMGIRSSDTTSVMYNNVKVPKENRIGADGFGFTFAMSTLNGGRIGIASQALGITQGAYELAVQYSQERETFGKPIAKHQAIAFKLADMATDIQAARLLILKAAYLKDEGKDFVMASAMAKYFAAEMAMKHTTEAVQIHGGYGYVSEYHVERLMRDAKVTQIYEGTSEIQQVIISRMIEKGILY